MIGIRQNEVTKLRKTSPDENLANVQRGFTQKRTRHRRNLVNVQQGFTLIEVLVSAAILVILGAGFLGFQYILSQNQIAAWNSYLTVEDANGITSQFVRELRDAREGENGNYPLIQAGDQEIIFYSDTDYDTVVEKIRYTLTSGTLTKGTTEPTGSPPTYSSDNEKTKVLTQFIRNGSDPIFYYYNKDWPNDTTNNPLPEGERVSQARLILVSLTVNSQDDPDSDYLVESYAKIRMLRGGQ